MCRNNLALEILALIFIAATAIALPLALPGPPYLVIPVGLFASYVGAETLVPKIYEEPPPNIAYDPTADDEEDA